VIAILLARVISLMISMIAEPLVLASAIASSHVDAVSPTFILIVSSAAKTGHASN
jgi:hypothetical protein